MTDTDLARRMFGARNHLERELGRSPTLEELGAETAKMAGRAKKPFAPSVIARWLKGQQEPKTRDLWLALAAVFRVDPGWLAFGEASAAAAPEGYRAEQPTDAKHGGKVHYTVGESDRTNRRKTAG